ncbi:MAG: hypothetical protein ABSF62_02400 [Bryobacteraceae bacterium]|jgi:hypothetical protein
MPSLVTSIIGGLQGSSAAHNAANAQVGGYTNAASTVNNAVSNANPIISNAAGAAGAGVSTAAGNAGAEATTAANLAQGGINTAAGNANATLSPYVANGTTASNNLNNLTSAGFSFNPSDLQDTPGYQFQLQQGLRGVNASGAASGLLNSGATAKAADQFAQGLASTTYNQQYQNALQGYQTNVNSLIPGAQMGLSAGSTTGSNLMNAAQYGGNVGLQAGEYAGTSGMQGAEYSGNAGMQAANSTAQNLVNAGVYTGNTQIGSGNAIAQGDVGAANQWNSMLGTIGQTGNSLLTAGFGGMGGSNPGTFSMGNMATGLGNLYSAGGWTGSGGMPGSMPGGGSFSPAGYYSPIGGLSGSQFNNVFQTGLNSQIQPGMVQ